MSKVYVDLWVYEYDFRTLPINSACINIIIIYIASFVWRNQGGYYRGFGCMFCILFGHTHTTLQIYQRNFSLNKIMYDF